jgi:hypothetical protein
VPSATFAKLASIINYEDDLAVSIMQQLDDHLLKLMTDKEKRDHEKAMAKAGRK